MYSVCTIAVNQPLSRRADENFNGKLRFLIWRCSMAYWSSVCRRPELMGRLVESRVFGVLIFQAIERWILLCRIRVG